jgi:hypothetical protein
VSNKITFTANDEYAWEVVDRPTPAYSRLPKWWRDMPTTVNGDKPRINNSLSNLSPKKCVSVLDSLTSGYIIPLWTDIQVKNVSNSEYIPYIDWKPSRPVFEGMIPGSELIPSPLGYSRWTCKFLNKWMINTPRGYSIAISAPTGYENSSLKAISAVVDTDKYQGPLYFPMWIKEGFEGIIERGTPLVQVTPFKREDWTSEFKSLKNGQLEIIQDRDFHKKIFGWYTSKVWAKKSYR